GVWSSAFPRMLPAPRAGQTVVWDANARKWQEAASVSFLDEIVKIKVQGEFQAFPYAKMPPLWLASPAEPSSTGRWHLRTHKGEELILGDGPTGRLSQEIQAVWQGQTVRLAGSEVRSIHFHAER